MRLGGGLDLSERSDGRVASEAAEAVSSAVEDVVGGGLKSVLDWRVQRSIF